MFRKLCNLHSSLSELSCLIGLAHGLLGERQYPAPIARRFSLKTRFSFPLKKQGREVSLQPSLQPTRTNSNLAASQLARKKDETYSSEEDAIVKRPI
jgi:hypothetical protein